MTINRFADCLAPFLRRVWGTFPALRRVSDFTSAAFSFKEGAALPPGNDEVLLFDTSSTERLCA